MTKQIQTVKPKLFMKKNGDCINIVWVDEGVSVGVGDNDQGYFFNENEWEMLNELLKPTRYSQETNEEKALNQIYELIASVRTNGAYHAESFVGGIIKDLLAQAQQEAYERGRRDEQTANDLLGLCACGNSKLPESDFCKDCI